MTYFLLVIGFVFLIKGADFFVDGSSSIAKMFRVPSMVIGMTIVAMGTSLPECSVSVSASITNNNALAISNAVGSNIFNLMVVCGACALFTPLAVKLQTLKGEFPFSILVAALLLVLGFLGMNLGRAEGIIMVVIFAGFLFWMVQSARKSRAMMTEEEEVEVLPLWKSILFIAGGGAVIALGGNMVVNSASSIAQSFGLSQNLIGLTIVAAGTSLPELATSMVAARKNEVDMALGNVIGSNIFNILLVLGVASSISPMAFVMENVIDIVVLIAMSVLVWGFAWTKKRIGRTEGIIMLLLYIGYMVYICMR